MLLAAFLQLMAISINEANMVIIGAIHREIQYQVGICTFQWHTAMWAYTTKQLAKISAASKTKYFNPIITLSPGAAPCCTRA